MCINVKANGRGIFAGTHVSVYVYLMKGEYDSRLVWPFRGDITIQLVNHNNDQDHHEWTVPFNDTAVDDSNVSGRMTLRRRADTGRGFVPHSAHRLCIQTRKFSPSVTV